MSLWFKRGTLVADKTFSYKNFMAKIDLNSYDLSIKKLTKGEFKGQKVVQINPRLAFDEEFIADMEEKGVKEYVEREEVNEE